MKRIFDLIFGIIILIIFFIPILLISFLIKLDTSGPIIYYSDRVGKDNKIFKMPKFRTMVINSPQVASDKLLDPDKYLTKIGKLLRKFSLDEIPQIFNVITGSMSIVGPRPALYNQKSLIEKRTKLGIEKLKPGITGLAQVNGRDKISLEEKISYDFEYLKKNGLFYDMKIIFQTAVIVCKGRDVSHWILKKYQT